jgi:uncharacterized protein YecT (DUF1311 family)
VIAAFVAMAVATLDCERVSGALPQDQCFLTQSMEISADCKKRESQADMNICSFRDYLQSDIELNRIWNAVTTRFKKNAISTPLLDGQRAWLRYRDRQCDVWAKFYEGGTIASLAVNSCMTDITKFRTNELKQLLDNN